MTRGKPDYLKTYHVIVAPANRALAAFQRQTQTLTAGTTSADAAKIAEPFANAIDTANQQLGAVRWPTVVADDMRELVAADNVTIADLRTVKSQTDATMTGWASKFTTDQHAVTIQIRRVLSDFDLLKRS
jgi:hypothetical protein